jgi:hypothetical protein
LNNTIGTHAARMLIRPLQVLFVGIMPEPAYALTVWPEHRLRVHTKLSAAVLAVPGAVVFTVDMLPNRNRRAVPRRRPLRSTC